MPLNEMSLQAMARLADDIDAVRAAMAILEDRGLSARADLTPGQPMVIRLVCRMGEVGHDFEDGPVPGEIVVLYNGAPVEDADPHKYARAAGLVDNEGFEVAPEATPITAEAPSKGKLDECALVSAPEPAVTGPGEAEQTAAPGPQPICLARWTEYETARLIEIMADRMERHGDTVRRAGEIAAAVLGRPVEGTLYKARSLVERIEAARRAVVGQVLDRLAPQEIPAGPPVAAVQDTAAEAAGETAASEGPEDAEGATLPVAASAPAVAGAGAPLTPTGELNRHLAKVKRDKPWTIERDHDLMHFSRLGWPAGDIALEIKVPVAEIKPRFALLTGTGRWKRAEVLAALAQMLATEPTAP